MSPRSTGRAVLARIWMPLVAVVAVGVGLLCMYKVHQFSEPEPVITVNGPQAPEQFNLKRITYEVFGSAGQGGKLVYVDIDGHPHQVDITTLPWTHTESTTLSVASGSISVHVHGGQVGCRMLVNDVVRDEQSGNHQDADVQCRVKSA
ncbi:MmpS family transport accessory protein [Mycobacterium avium]|uniref:MmpS2 n=2 Tax=Mycobacterium avium TaxID=1764 RepID=Q73V84_MYCPA|nr:MmpS family transport accessory protein [Mycobacterium avium]ETB00323.1 hypothetical protein O982_04065 [Mycobacterium avium 10-5581]ETB05727.1 hypothetical protein O979_03490 [Mycobacterium avium subsp. paratuberculosis 10-4404]ETB07220.1 hypothetical protein O978_03690 [Mycobacterium avium subsp. paratuberculosis 10-5864]ETB14031.1 hypothetical protein O980_03545 [Mycobacterium avium subsp. paratuberculosis 08-8281]ETB35137.1 hypothetical protein O977_03875 [Mycobacterium avium subsp. par